MLNRQENQQQKKEFKTVSKRAEYLGCAYSTIPNDAFEVIFKFKSNITTSIALYLYKYFSSETGNRKNYKAFVISDLEKALDKNKSSLITPFKELEESGLFIFINLCQKGKIALLNNVLGKQYHQEYLEGKRQFDIKNKEVIINTDVVVNFPTQQNTNLVVHSDVLPRTLQCTTPYTLTYYPVRSDVLPSNLETIVNSELETLSKNVQESLLKKPIQETSLDHLGSSSKKNNFTANLFDDLEKIDWVFRNELKEEKEVKTSYEKKEIEPKKIFSENKQEQVKKDFPELQQDHKRNSEAIKDLTDSEREVQAFLTKDLEILNQDLFFSFVRKLPNDVILSKARYVLEKVSSGKVTSPEGFLRAILSKEVAKNETSGNVEVTGLVKQNDYKPVILYFSDKKMIGNKDRNVTNTNRIDDYSNIEKNKSCIAFEIYSIYCKGYKENKQEFKPMLSDIFNDIRKLIHLQDFKEILATNSYIYSVQNILIDMFRGENN